MGDSDKRTPMHLRASGYDVRDSVLHEELQKQRFTPIYGSWYTFLQKEAKNRHSWNLPL